MGADVSIVINPIGTQTDYFTVGDILISHFMRQDLRDAPRVRLLLNGEPLPFRAQHTLFQGLL
jgi:hypothetical protein